MSNCLFLRLFQELSRCGGLFWVSLVGWFGLVGLLVGVVLFYFLNIFSFHIINIRKTSCLNVCRYYMFEKAKSYHFLGFFVILIKDRKYSFNKCINHKAH